jgi:membrane carboxypeptidase/penicillin-binding protein PbpC
MNHADRVRSRGSRATYELHASQLGRETLQLNATAGSEIESLYWFADGAFVGTSHPSAPLTWAPTGTGDVDLSVVAIAEVQRLAISG